MSPKSPEILANTPESEPKKVTDISREALAKRLGIDESALPDGKFFRIVDAQLDKLAGLDPAKQASELRAHLEKIDMAEAADKARELGEDGKQLLASEALEQSAGAVKAATEKLKTEGLAHGKDAVAAVGALAGAKSIADATKGIDGIAKVIDGAGKMISGALDTIKDIFASLWKTLGLDKLFKSIGGLFGLNSGVSSEAPGKSEDESIEGSPNSPVREGIDAITNKEKREKILVDYAAGLGDMISREYFGGDKLSSDQLRRIQEILEKNLPIDILQKIEERYQKDGDIQVGEIATAIIELMAKFPASVVLELAFSDIIPYWAIVQKFAIEPGKSLINLTIDGLPFVDVPVSLDTFGNFIDQKLKDQDSRALDVARVQLYGASGLVWKLLGSATAGVAGLGMMFTDTTTGVDGKKMLTAGLMREYDRVADMFGKIEQKLSPSGTPKSDILNQYIGAVKEVQNNARIMQVVADNADDKIKMIAELRKLNSTPPGLNIAGHIDELSGLTQPNLDSRYRDTLKKMLVGRESSTATWGQGFSRIAKEYLGGLDGATLQNLQKLDAIKARQVDLIGSKGLKAIRDNFMLAMDSLTIARSVDTMVIHLEDTKDVSKFRAFLATIPGGIRGLAEFLPAASVIFSLGRIGYEGLKNEPGVDGEKGESFLDVLAYAVFPLYGTGLFLWSQRFNLRDFVSKGNIPPITDLAVTSVLGGVALIEAKRVGGAIYDIGKGAYTFDGKRITNGLRRVTYIDDLARSVTSMVRGGRNIAALKPSIRPEFAKGIASIAAKMPKRGRLAIGGVALAGFATGVAYALGEDSPEEIQEQFQRDGYLDEHNNPTEKLKSLFYQKTLPERKEILDALFVLHHGSNDNLPKTHYEEGIYSLVAYTKKSELVDSVFRKSLQSLGMDIEFVS